jgi:hypothetical protein
LLRECVARRAVEEANSWHRPSLLRARRERPCGFRAAQERDEVAPLHCPILEVLKTEA